MTHEVKLCKITASVRKFNIVLHTITSFRNFVDFEQRYRCKYGFRRKFQTLVSITTGKVNITRYTKIRYIVDWALSAPAFLRLSWNCYAPIFLQAFRRKLNQKLKNETSTMAHLFIKYTSNDGQNNAHGKIHISIRVRWKYVLEETYFSKAVIVAISLVDMKQ